MQMTAAHSNAGMEHTTQGGLPAAHNTGSHDRSTQHRRAAPHNTEKTAAGECDAAAPDDKQLSAQVQLVQLHAKRGGSVTLAGSPVADLGTVGLPLPLKCPDLLGLPLRIELVPVELLLQVALGVVVDLDQVQLQVGE